MDQNIVPNNPFVSVVMSVYNSAKYLRLAIDSILAQTYSNFEFIIINDGSTDESLSIITSYTDNRIKLIDNKDNKGLIYSLNKGIEFSNGKYICRMDADDISLPQRIELQTYFLENNLNIGVCSCDYIQFTANKKTEHNASIYHDDILGSMLFNSSVIHPSLMIRTELLKRNDHPYDSNFKHAEDYELWSRLIFQTKFSSVSELLFKYRLHDNQVTEVHKQEQIKSANLVRKNMLQNTGFIFSDKELDIHNKIGSSQLLRSFNDLKQSDIWLRNMLVQNNKNKFIDQSIFNTIIGKQWLDTCGNTNLGLQAFFYYFKSDLKHLYKCNIAKLFAKSLIRKFFK